MGPRYSKPVTSQRRRHGLINHLTNPANFSGPKRGWNSEVPLYNRLAAVDAMAVRARVEFLVSGGSRGGSLGSDEPPFGSRDSD